MASNMLTLPEVSARLGGRPRSDIFKDVVSGQLPRPVLWRGDLLWLEVELDQAASGRPLQ
jgi:prophage regulatory protein